MTFTSTSAKVLALAGLGILAAPLVQARPFISAQYIRQQPQISARQDLSRFRQPQSSSNYQPFHNHTDASHDYQAFAPSVPTSGPQGIWKYGSCDNIVRVLVSNIGDVAGPTGTVTLTVPEPIDDSDYFNAPTVNATYTRTFASIDAGDHTWIEFNNVDFPEVFDYDLNATVTAGNDSNLQNNSRTVSVFVNHACS